MAGSAQRSAMVLGSKQAIPKDALLGSAPTRLHQGISLGSWGLSKNRHHFWWERTWVDLACLKMEEKIH